MSVLATKSKSLLSVVKNINNIAIKAVKEQSNLMADMNRNQLMKGQTALGGSMPLYKSNSKAPQAPGKIKLFDKGGFQSGIKPLFNTEGVLMTSTDEKESFLDPKYPTALGIAPNNKAILKPKIVDAILKDIRPKL